MNAAISVKVAVEVVGEHGPTGEFREATHLEVQDYGGNVIWRGAAEAYDARHGRGNKPLRLVATRVAPNVYAGHEIHAGILADFMGD